MDSQVLTTECIGDQGGFYFCLSLTEQMFWLLFLISLSVKVTSEQDHRNKTGGRQLTAGGSALGPGLKLLP